MGLIGRNAWWRWIYINAKLWHISESDQLCNLKCELLKTSQTGRKKNNYIRIQRNKQAVIDTPVIKTYNKQSVMKEVACPKRQVPLLSSISSSRECSERGSTGAWSTATLFWLMIFSFSFGLGFLRLDAVADKLCSWQSPDSVKQTPSWV